MTVAENIATVPRLLGWSKAEISERVDELLDFVDLPARDYRSRYASQLSGGERQRVGLARALAADPPVMLMDEPFGALDPITRTRLQKELLRIQSELRKTIIFVTHDIDEAILIGDRIAILREGGVLAQYDTPDELLAHPADEFVARFVGADRGLKRLSLRRRSASSSSSRVNGAVGPLVDASTTLRDAVSTMLAEGATSVVVEARTTSACSRSSGSPSCWREMTGGNRSSRSSARRSDCVRENRTFCSDWVHENWEPILRPRLVEHVQLTVIAVVDRIRDRARPPRCWPTGCGGSRRPFGDRRRRLLYTIPSLALFQLLVPITGLTVTTVEVALVSLHAPDPLPEHPLRPPQRASGGARGGTRDGPRRGPRRSCASSCRSRCLRSSRGSGSPP